MFPRHIVEKRPESKSQEEAMLIENALDPVLLLGGAKIYHRIMRRLPNIQSESVLMDKWTKAASENILRGLEHGEDLAELKNKVEELSSGLESLKGEVVSCKECIDKLYLEFADRPIVRETRLFDIAEDLEVIEPIPIVIEETDNESVASFSEVEVFAVGAGEAEAINNLKKEIRKLYYELNTEPDERLGRVPQSWKRVLKKVLKRVGNT